MVNDKIVINNDFLDEKYIKIKHSSGLNVFLINKEMSTSYAIFATNFGSMDNKLLVSEKEIKFPDGIAHFLEHKLFEEPDESDAFERFSLYGANANAYTTYDKTCYLFSCTDNLYENLEILLDFVTNPVFNEKSINKEIGIISQEIAMGDDDPNRCVYNNMIRSMYHNSPIIADISGDINSISEVTPELLFSAYNTFYTLDNMALCICGVFEEEKVIDICDKILKKSNNQKPTIPQILEPRSIKNKKCVTNMIVAQPIYSFGFKGDIVSSSLDLMRKFVSLLISTKAIFGRSSSFFEKNYSSGLINKSFSVNIYSVKNHLFSVVDGTAQDPYKVYDAIISEIELIKKNKINNIDFNRAKKSIYSNVIMAFDSTEEIANNFISCAFEEYDFFDYIKTIIDITPGEAYNDFIELFDEQYSVLSIILPKN